MPIKKNTRIYADLDLDFTPHPLTGDLPMKYNDESIKRALRNLVNTSAHDRKFHPEVNSGVRDYLFEPMSLITALSIETHLKYVIQQHEPRVNLIDLTVEADNEQQSYDVTITFNTINNIEPIQTKVFLQRVR
jgi:predicted component of type VI protein secretion system